MEILLLDAVKIAENMTTEVRCQTAMEWLNRRVTGLERTKVNDNTVSPGSRMDDVSLAKMEIKVDQRKS